MAPACSRELGGNITGVCIPVDGGYLVDNICREPPVPGRGRPERSRACAGGMHCAASPRLVRCEPMQSFEDLVALCIAYRPETFSRARTEAIR